ncbi:MAG: LicD family protein [Ruminococcus sp.]|nr:LicD family protein [Ruminococcus sp.]
MSNSFSKNEIFMSSEYLKAHGTLPKAGTVINVIGTHLLCDYIADTISVINDKTEYRYTVYQGEKPDALTSTVSTQCFLYCLDLRNEDTYALIELCKALDYACKIKNAKFIAMVIIPPLSKRHDVMSLSEIELSKVSSETILSDVENTLSSYTDRLDIREIRFDNFLAEDSNYNALNLTAIASDALSSGCVTIDSEDAFDTVSAISISDAVNAVFTVLKNGKQGNIYNASGEPMSLYEAKSFVYKALCSYGITLDFMKSDSEQKKSFRVLDCGKMISIGYSPLCDNETRLLYALSGLLPEKYDIITDKLNSLYNGKLNYIREMELELLREVDRICRRNNIQYFLSGGTMLGAVRHKGFIPWDDDIDIAMLREDYEKFKEVCITELSKKYQYQSFTNKDGYHYFFDKITIKDTYFSTKYSDKFDMLKGISMDIFVFDKTSDNKFFQKLHFKTLMALRLITNVRWINHPRKDKSYLLSKILLPILRIFKTDTYCKVYDKVLRRYEKRDTSTVLPPATDHKWRGVMPKKWFEKVEDAGFEDVMSYIPIGYDDYLKQWYCEDYMELLPLCNRVGSHDFYRLDIGNEISTLGQDEYIRHFDYKGELL